VLQNLAALNKRAKALEQSKGALQAEAAQLGVELVNAAPPVGEQGAGQQLNVAEQYVKLLMEKQLLDSLQHEAGAASFASLATSDKSGLLGKAQSQRYMSSLESQLLALERKLGIPQGGRWNGSQPQFQVGRLVGLSTQMIRP
jgi:hypothetical protein